MKAEIKQLTKKDGTVSDKCFVVVGGKEIKDSLKANKGTFSHFWNIEGTATPGWMFANNKKAIVEELLKGCDTKIEVPAPEIKVTETPQVRAVAAPKPVVKKAESNKSSIPSHWILPSTTPPNLN